jgi:hypothetical protein
MKRDWDLIRKQLTDIEEENDPFADKPIEPMQGDKPWDAYENELKDHRKAENRFFGHYELLIKAGYIEGLTVRRSLDGQFFYGVHSPRLTMAGHDLLDTMRSSGTWGKIKELAKAKGVELTFDAIKVLGALALKQLV